MRTVASPSPKITELPVTDLIGVDKSAYGDLYASHVLEQYQLYVTMADEISKRRHNANSFFLSVCTAVVGLLAVAHDDLGPGWASVVALSAILLCFGWSRILRSYRDLNSAKFRVVHAIEALLPLKPYDAEWSLVKRGGDDELYKPLSHVEMVVPKVFSVLFTVLILFEIVRVFL